MHTRRTLPSGVGLLAAVACLLSGISASSMATPTVTILKVEDHTDMHGGPWSLPPSEPSPPDQIPPEPYPDDPPAIPEGYVTDRSRHRSADLYIEVEIANATDPVVVSLDWLGVSNPDEDEPTYLGTVELAEVSGSEGARYAYTTGTELPARVCGTYYSFDIRVTDASSSATQSWVKRAPGLDSEPARRWVQLGCTAPEWEHRDPDNIEIGHANGYRPYYLRLGTHTFDIATEEYNRVDRYRHDSGTDGGHYDTGALVRDLPGPGVEQRSCSQYLVYWFDESVAINGLTNIGNAYFHIWFSQCGILSPGASVQRTRGWLAGSRPSLGVGALENPGSIVPTFYWNGNEGHHEICVNPVYSLRTGAFDVTENGEISNSFSGNSIYEMYFRLDAAVGYPSCITSRRNPSFVCFNVPPEILDGTDTTTDTDKDGLPDSSELLAALTSPFLPDTDADGLADALEWNAGAGGRAPNDPCNLQLTCLGSSGTTWMIGDVVRITFNQIPQGCSEAHLLLKRGEAGSWQKLTTSSLPEGATSFEWHVTGPASEQCWIKEAFDVADPGDTCDEAFEIRGCEELTYPRGGEIWEIGDSKVIRFRPILAECPGSRLFLRRTTAGPWTELTSGPLPVGADSFPWLVTGPASTQCRIKLAASALAPGDQCDYAFEIKSGHAGCPFLYTRQSGSWIELNTILASVAADVAGRPDADVIDRVVLSGVPTVENGEYQFEIREFESERSWISGVGLEIVDHPAGTELGVTERGELFLFGSGVAPDKATDGHGVDRLADVIAADERVFNGVAGDVLVLEYPMAAEGAVSRIQLVTANKLPLDLGGADQDVAGTMRGLHATFDVPGRPTPLAEVRVEPRENLSPIWRELPNSTVEVAGSTDRIRVKLEWGSDHSLDFAGLVAPIDARPEVRPLVLTKALNQDGALLTGSLDVAAPGIGPTILDPGGKIRLSFRADPSEPRGRRDFVFTSRGHYTHIETGHASEKPSASLELTVTPIAANSAGVEIRFSIDRADEIRVDIFSVSGRLVRTLSQGRLEAGRHAMVWDGRDADSRMVGAGMYFCKVTTSQQDASGRIVITR